MKITKIKIKNLFGISEYEGNGKSLELIGKNGTGKTSVLDAIKLALTNKSDRDYIVRQGELEGEILIETDTGLSINRKPRTNMSDYKSIKDNGKEIASPEAFLSTIFTELQLNPVKFIQMDSKEQNRIILDLIEFDWDLNWIREQFGEIPQGINYEQNILQVLNDIQSERGFFFTQRQDINRDIRNKKAFIADIVKDIPDSYNAEKWQGYNLGEVYKQIESARTNNALIEKAKGLRDNYTSKIRAFEAEKEMAISEMERNSEKYKGSLETEIARLEEQIKAAQEKLSKIGEQKQQRLETINAEFEAKCSQYKGEVESFAKYEKLEYQDTSELLQEVETAEQMKAHLNEYGRMTSLQKEINNLQGQAEEYTRKIELARTLPAEILQQAELPITDLEIKDGIPLIKGLPVSNLSEGEKLDLCIDIAISNPNSLQILLIDGIEKLSTDNREKLYKKCTEKGLQFIATRTTDDTDLTVIELDKKNLKVAA